MSRRRLRAACCCREAVVSTYGPCVPPVPLDSRRVRLRFPGHLSEAKSHRMARGGESSMSMNCGHGNPLGRTREFDELEVCQRNKSELESRANRLTTIPGGQFLEDVPKMGFDRGRRQ